MHQLHLVVLKMVSQMIQKVQNSHVIMKDNSEFIHHHPGNIQEKFKTIRIAQKMVVDQIIMEIDQEMVVVAEVVVEEEEEEVVSVVEIEIEISEDIKFYYSFKKKR